MSAIRYPDYKPTGVAWLGEVPSHWSLEKVKRFAQFSGGGTPSREKMAYWNGEIPWVSSKDMKFESIRGAEESITPEGLANSSSNVVPVGSLLMVVRSGILKHTIPVGITAAPVAVNQDLKVFSFDESRCLAPFFLRWVQGLNDQLLLAWSKQGATVESLEHEYLANTVVPLPDIQEQSSIIAFLDREIAKIDELVEEQRRLIALLDEKRQAAISQAVAKGLNPDVPMKASGVEWLGDVPEHWVVSALKHAVEDIKAGPFGSSLTKDMYVSEGLKVYGQEQVIPNDFSIGDYFVTEEKGCELSQYRVSQGDILISCVGTFGRVAEVPAGAVPGIMNPRLMRLRCAAKVRGDYLAEVLRSDTIAEQFVALSRGGTMDVINIGTLKEIVLVIPPLDEQGKIVSYLAVEGEKWTALSCEASTAMTVLIERRAALITAAVTGQIDVRALAPTEAP